MSLMGMFDSYEPVPPLQCHSCREPLRRWQGKDSRNLLLQWREGVAEPEADPCLPVVDLELIRLPESFSIQGGCDACGWPAHATGFAPNGVWNVTVAGDHVPEEERARAAFIAPSYWQCDECAAHWDEVPGGRSLQACPGCGVLVELKRELDDG